MVRNRYLSTDGSKTICEERCRLTFVAEPEVHRIDRESSFSSADDDLYFGDQEEMGARSSRGLTTREEGGNGRTISSEGLEGAMQTWGQVASWCDYSGTIGSQHVGVTIMTAPGNARSSWWHNRGYGLFVANMFGREAMKQGPRSRVKVERGDTFRLGYRILLHSSRDGPPDLDNEYHFYLNSLDGR